MLETTVLTTAFGCDYHDSEASSTSADLRRKVGNSPALSPQEKRKVRLCILNPPPGGHDSISLYHAERHINRGRAFVDDEGRLVFIHDQPVDGDSAMIRRTHNTANLRSILAEFTAHRNERLVEMTTVLPIYYGESEPDGIARQVRNRGPKRTPASDK